MNLKDEILSIGNRIGELLPIGALATVNYCRYQPDQPYVSLQVFCEHDRAEALRIMRELGFAISNKSILDQSSEPSYILTNQADGFRVTCFLKGLPPTCKLVETIERIPKTQTIETGDFIEVKRMKVQCTDELQPATP